MTAAGEREFYMREALAEARTAFDADEVPVGAVLVRGGEIVARAHNRCIELSDPTAHAELAALSEGARKLSGRLDGCTLYVTLEPCAMCAAAISFARVRRLYYGAADAKGGAVDHNVRFFASSSCHHAPEVYAGLCECDAAEKLKSFFAERR